MKTVRSFVVVGRILTSSTHSLLASPRGPCGMGPQGAREKNRLSDTRPNYFLPSLLSLLAGQLLLGSSLEQKRMNTHTVWLAGQLRIRILIPYLQDELKYPIPLCFLDHYNSIIRDTNMFSIFVTPKFITYKTF